MLLDNKIQTLIEKIETLQASVNILSEMMVKMQKDNNTLGEWRPEEEIIALTGLSRSTLLSLRKSGKIAQSSITGKTKYYRLSCFKKLLDKNEKETQTWK